jgi:hypothetical protein
MLTAGVTAIPCAHPTSTLCMLHQYACHAATNSGLEYAYQWGRGGDVRVCVCLMHVVLWCIWCYCSPATTCCSARAWRLLQLPLQVCVCKSTVQLP